MLELIIHEKNVETVNEEKFIRGTVGAKCKIIFDEFWQNYEKTVVFKNNDFSNPPKKVFVSETVNVIEIPPEILTKLGYFVIGAYGITEDEKLPTLYSEEFDVVYGTDTECVEPESYTPNEIEQLRLSKQDKLTAGKNINIDENNVISAEGGGSDDLTDYVKNTDYATAQKGGVLKIVPSYGTNCGNGILTSLVRDLTQYENMPDTAFISKGTLENVLAKKIGDIEKLLGGI